MKSTIRARITAGAKLSRHYVATLSEWGITQSLRFE